MIYQLFLYMIYNVHNDLDNGYFLMPFLKFYPLAVIKTVASS
jgi:hypothetical protein